MIQPAMGQAKDMPFRISKTISNPPLESLLRRLADHKPVTMFGITFQESGHWSAGQEKARIDTAAEYCQWLMDNDALLEDPR